MRDGQHLSYTELRDAAVQAVLVSQKTQREVAILLDVTPSWVSRALNKKGEKYAGLQSRIISALTDFDVQQKYVLARRSV